MFSGKSEGEQSLVTFRLTDLHQPTTAVLLGTPVPPWPQETSPSPDKELHVTDVSKETLNGEFRTPIEPGQVPEATVQEVLKLLDGVDLSFMCVHIFIEFRLSYIGFVQVFTWLC